MDDSLYMAQTISRRTERMPQRNKMNRYTDQHILKESKARTKKII